MQDRANLQGPGVIDRRAGKYLMFNLAEEEYGFEILKVREILGATGVTGVPGMPEAMLGVVNLRGKVIPIIDLRRRFAMDTAPFTAETCFIIVSIDDRLSGVVVDRVSEVADIHAEDIEDAPLRHENSGREYLTGMAKVKGRVRMLLDISRIVTLDAELPLNAV